MSTFVLLVSEPRGTQEVAGCSWDGRKKVIVGNEDRKYVNNPTEPC